MKAPRFTLAAEEDLVDIETYLFEQSETAAERILDDIEAACRLLETHPGAGRHREGLGSGVPNVFRRLLRHVQHRAHKSGRCPSHLHGNQDIPTVP